MDFAKCLSNFAHEIWEDWFRNPKLLFAVNKLIHLNTSTNKDIRSSRPLVSSGLILLNIE